MAAPVVHFEIVGADAAHLRSYFAALFGWEYDTTAPVAEEVSTAGDYGFIDLLQAPDGAGIRGGVGGGQGHAPRAMFYVGVPDVEAALAEAERLGGTRLMGPARNPAGHLVVGHFADPEGNLIGVAGPQ